MSSLQTEQHRALIVVDPQVDFVSGSLAVPDAQAAIDVIAKLVWHYPLVAISRDWHPSNHMSFSSYPKFEDGSWPSHCVAQTHGAWLADRRLEGFMLFSKGTNKRFEAYSAFDGRNKVNERLAPWLRSSMAHMGLDTVEIVGLALDYCVKATALDAKKLGFNTMVNLLGTRGVTPATSHAAILEMAEAGVKVGSAKMRHEQYLPALERGILPRFE